VAVPAPPALPALPALVVLVAALVLVDGQCMAIARRNAPNRLFVMTQLLAWTSVPRKVSLRERLPELLGECSEEVLVVILAKKSRIEKEQDLLTSGRWAPLL